MEVREALPATAAPAGHPRVRRVRVLWAVVPLAAAARAAAPRVEAAAAPWGEAAAAPPGPAAGPTRGPAGPQAAAVAAAAAAARLAAWAPQARAATLPAVLAPRRVEAAARPPAGPADPWVARSIVMAAAPRKPAWRPISIDPAARAPWAKHRCPFLDGSRPSPVQPSSPAGFAAGAAEDGYRPFFGISALRLACWPIRARVAGSCQTPRPRHHGGHVRPLSCHSRFLGDRSFRGCVRRARTPRERCPRSQDPACPPPARPCLRRVSDRARNACN